MKYSLILISTLLWTHTFWSQIQPEVKLDGKIESHEWKSARKFDLINTGKLYLLKSKTALYVALQGNESGWAHVYLHYNDTVHVFHASAALGAAKYVKRGNTWSPANLFQYSLRDTVYDHALELKQGIYMSKYGWVANNNGTGSGHTLEFMIDLTRWKVESVRVAFVFQTDSKQPQYFPNSLRDDTLLDELVYGNTPDSLIFNIKEWYSIK